MKRSARLAAGAVWVALALGFGLPAGLNTAVAHAQNIGIRTVNGSVVNADSAAVQGATVFLRNAKTKAIRSYTSNDQGRFRFAQVNMTDDYDLWAEKDGKKSAIKTVSSWDTRKEAEYELKIK